MQPDEASAAFRPLKSLSSSRHDISDSLSKLDGKLPKEQAAFWKSVAITKAKEMEEIGGLAPDEIMNDVLNRFFDSSTQGLSRVFAFCLRDQKDEELTSQGLMSKRGLQDALNEHFQYYHCGDVEGELKPDAQKCFDTLCDKVELPLNEVSFGYAVRRLRLGILLKMYHLAESSSHVYHVDYDDHKIYTPFNYRVPDQFHITLYKKMVYTVPVLQKQDPVDDLEEYLFTSKMRRQGKTHWVHLHKPKIALVLAIGQIYRMPGTIQTKMRNLKQAQPQIHFGRSLEHKVERRRASRADASVAFEHPDEPAATEPVYEWSSLIYPKICLDYASKRSLERFQQWERKREKGIRQESDAPPSLFIAVVEFSMGKIWSDAGTNTIVTLCSPASYVGKWITDDPESQKKSSSTKTLDFLTGRGDSGGCCRRAKRRDGYQEVSQHDPDHDDHDPEIGEKKRLTRQTTANMTLDEEEIAKVINGEQDEAGMEANDGNVSRVDFDGVFEKTLLALSSKSSLLRMGNNEQLMTRMILNSTQEYLDVAAIYDCGIQRIAWLLEKPGIPDKDGLIQKIGKAKLELGHLLRIVAPFAEHVVTALQNLHSPLEIVNFQIKLIENNVHTFVPKCKALIDRCESLCDSYDRKSNSKMNNILNILTFITFVITPLQILTGLYGMNFKVMPELEWRHGYYYFWTLGVSLSMLFALILYHMTQEDRK